MDKQTFTNIFVKQYSDLMLSARSHDAIKQFNNNLAKYSYLLVYPSDSDEPDRIQLLVGFANQYEIHQFGAHEDMVKAMTQIKSNPDFCTVSKELTVAETVVIPTADFPALPLRKIAWEELINAPKLQDEDFDVLQSSFLEYFNLDEHAYQEGNDTPFDFREYFSTESNKPEQLELREVWHDADWDGKYGNIEILIFWKSEFIGWITRTGRYLESYAASTINLEKWTDLMDTIYKSSGYKPGRNVNGVSVYNMETDDVDDVAYVPGVSTRHYTSD